MHGRRRKLQCNYTLKPNSVEDGAVVTTMITEIHRFPYEFVRFGHTETRWDVYIVLFMWVLHGYCFHGTHSGHGSSRHTDGVDNDVRMLATVSPTTVAD